MPCMLWLPFSVCVYPHVRFQFSTLHKCCSVKIHMRTHTGENTVTPACTTCNKAFSVASSLKIHMRTHTGEKPYTCKTCNKAFSRAAYLRAHMRSHVLTQTGEKPRTNTCYNGFSETGHLKVHMQTPSGEKPHTCKILCGIAFSSLRRP